MVRGLFRVACIVGALFPPAAWAFSPFAGEWQGEWHDGKSGQGGTFQFSIGPTGSLTGTVSNGEVKGPIQGSVADDGTSSQRYSMDGRTVIDVQAKMKREGNSIQVEDTFLAPDGSRMGGVQFTVTGTPTTMPEPKAEARRPAPPVDPAQPQIHEGSLEDPALPSMLPSDLVGLYGCYFRLKGAVRRSSESGFTLLHGDAYKARDAAGRLSFDPLGDRDKPGVLGKVEFSKGPLDGKAALAVRKGNGDVTLEWQEDEGKPSGASATLCYLEGKG